MKYIRTYEVKLVNSELQVEPGDYIKVKTKEYNYAKVIKKEYDCDSRGHAMGSAYYYSEFIFRNEIVKSWIKEDDIERKLTTKEIDKYKENKATLKAANKYNL